MSEVVSVASGSVAETIEVLSFLAGSADHSLRTISLAQLKKQFVETYTTLGDAMREDGFPIDGKSAVSPSLLHLVSGRVERDVVIARLQVDGSISSIDYVLEGSRLLGRRFLLSAADAAFLDHEVITDDSTPVFVTGSNTLLGNWEPERALPLSDGGSGRGGHHWFVRIPALLGETLEFKFLKKLSRWEAGANRTFHADRPGTVTTSDRFRE